MKTPTWIGHLDADCFYVSCERIRTPAIVRLPVGVLGNWGACVIAKSYEMKAAGVKTGMPIWDAVRCCPHGVYIKRDFHWYEVISRQLLELLQSVSPRVEYYSIDEMFFDADTLPQLFRVPLAQAVAALQQRILREINVPVSIGISLSRSLAKMAADDAKPLGCRVLIDPGEIEAFLAERPVEEVAGIGRRSRKKLAEHGIETCRDFTRARRLLIRQLLTIKGEALWWELRGTPAYPIQTERPPHRTISRGGSMGEATDDPRRLTAWLVRNLERLTEELDYYQVCTDRLALLLDYKAGGHSYQRRALPAATARFDLLAAAGKEMLAAGTGPTRAVHRMHVLADQLSQRPFQGSLFPELNPQAERVAQVKQFVNARAGRFAVRSGDTLPLTELYRDEASSYDICDVHGKHCF